MSSRIPIDLETAKIGEIFELGSGTLVYYSGKIQHAPGADPERVYCLNYVGGNSEIYRYRNGGFFDPPGTDPMRDVVAKRGESRSKLPVAAKKFVPQVDLTTAYLGQRCVRRDGTTAILESRTPRFNNLRNWPYYAGGQSYRTDGAFLDGIWEHDKDIVRLLPIPRKQSPLKLSDLLRLREKGPKVTPAGTPTPTILEYFFE